MGEEPELQQCQGTKVPQHWLQAQLSPASPAGLPILPWPVQWAATSRRSPPSRRTQNPQCWTCVISATLSWLFSEGNGGNLAWWAPEAHPWGKQQQELSVNESIGSDGQRWWRSTSIRQPHPTSDSWDRISPLLQLIHFTPRQPHPTHGCSSWHSPAPPVHPGEEALLPEALADYCSHQDAQWRWSRRRNDSSPAQLQPTKRWAPPATSPSGTDELNGQRLRSSLPSHPQWVPDTPAQLQWRAAGGPTQGRYRPSGFLSQTRRPSQAPVHTCHVPGQPTGKVQLLKRYTPGLERESPSLCLLKGTSLWRNAVGSRLQTFTRKHNQLRGSQCHCGQKPQPNLFFPLLFVQRISLYHIGIAQLLAYY